MPKSRTADTPIAIIGLAGVFPDARNIEEFWQNILANHVAIRDVPKHRWDPELFWSSDRSEPDKTYSRIGGFLRDEDLKFDARRFRIPPKTLKSVDTVQQLAVSAVADALSDANLKPLPNADEGREFDRDRCAVIIGNAMGGTYEKQTVARTYFPQMAKALLESPAFQGLSTSVKADVLAQAEEGFKAGLPPITEDTMPGELSNCVAGRIANALDLRGTNFTTDAACAASMAALKSAIDGLRLGQYDLAVAGGADQMVDPSAYIKFSKIGALSAEHSVPFDARANGFVMGEGVGIVVLKRLEDAERDGDTVYAVIQGIGAASDGKGKGMTAPNPRGQRLAVERAYEDAGLPISSVGLIEAHGTSTVVGDATEVGVLTELLKRESDTPTKIPLGSVKSMIGHLKAAAGAASVIKVALALHHKTLPPSAGFQSAPETSPLTEGYLEVSTKARPWDSQGPRRAGVSAFGFGGTNSHIVIEEYPGPGRTKARTTTRGEQSPATATAMTSSVATKESASMSSNEDVLKQVISFFAEATGYEAADLDPDYDLEADLGIDTVKQAEVLSDLRERYGVANDEGFELSQVSTLRAVANYLASRSTNPVEDSSAEAPRFDGWEVLAFGGNTAEEAGDAARSALAAEHWPPASSVLGSRAEVIATSNARLAFAANTGADAKKKADSAGKRSARVLNAQGIFATEGQSLASKGSVAFVFPGQGSQFLGMYRDLAELFPVVRKTFEEADEVLEPLIGSKLTRYTWADANTDEEKQAAELQLRQTEITQPAMLTADVAMFRLLGTFGLRPSMVVGHSLGEYAACVAAGVMTFAEALYAVSARGREMAHVKVADNGKMASIAAGAHKVEPTLGEIPGYVIAANKNCHAQTVIAGESKSVELAVEKFTAAGIDAREIPVSHAFHSKIVAPASEPLKNALRRLDIKAPKIPILSNVHAGFYPDDKEAIIDLLGQQLESSVEFIDQIEAMYSHGARVFIECGPRRAATGFVRNVLGNDREYQAVATNHHKRPAIEPLMGALALMASEGVEIDFTASQPDPLAETATRSSVGAPESEPTRQEPPKAKTVVSGLSILPPTDDMLGDLNGSSFDRLLSGENLIRSVPDPVRQALVDKNIIRLEKTSGDFTRLQELSEVIQLAARAGGVDIVAKYGIDENLNDALDTVCRYAIASGIEALRDAGIPLVRHYRTTSTGKKLPDRWGLPDSISERTGVIVGTAFGPLDRIIEDVSQHVASNRAGKTRSKLEALVDSLTGVLKDDTERAAARRLAAPLLEELDAESKVYEFSRKFLFRTLAMAHAQVAQVISARGPNALVNAACASGTLGIGVAYDWLRLGKADRVLVIGADDVTNDTNLPYIGAGFLAAGAATTLSDVTEAAVPFGAKRNGMILGSGAAALVLERDDHVAGRGMEPVAEVMQVLSANSAFHGTRLNTKHIAKVVRGFVDEALASEGISRDAMAKQTFFMSHETYTPARGGSSQAEVDALTEAFEGSVGDVIIANTKGQTGHPMGANLEDAVAIKALQRKTLPAVANLNEVDPAFDSLTFARGGSHEAKYALHLAAGFGSQIGLALFKQRAVTEERLNDADAYHRWLDGAVSSGAKLEIEKRTLRVAEKGGVRVDALGIRALTKAPAAPVVGEPVAKASAVSSGAVSSRKDRATLLVEITRLFADESGYEVSDLEPTFELEADLGIDTVKQAEIFTTLRERYGLPSDEEFKLSDVPTLNAVVDYVMSFDQAGPAPAAPETPSAPVSSGKDRATLLVEITQLFADESGYEVSDLEPAFELEADLGIDTVKQAEIFTTLRERYGLPSDEEFKLSDVPTLNAVVDYVMSFDGGPGPNQTPPSGGGDERLGKSKATHASAWVADSRFHVRPTERAELPALRSAPASFAGRTVALIGIGNGSEAEPFHQAVREALLAAGANVHHVPPSLGPSALESCLANLGGQAATDLLVVGPELVSDWEAVEAVNRVAFRAAAAFARARSSQGDARVAFVLRTDGVFGSGSRDPAGWAAGGLSGLAKSLDREWPDGRVVALDLDRAERLGSSSERLLQEVSTDGPSEVAYLGGKRYTLRRSEKPYTPAAAGLPSGTVIVASGGARGVTYEVVKALCERSPLKVVLIGRTQPCAPGDSVLHGKSETEQKDVARAALQARGERTTPVAIKRYIARELARIEVHENARALEALGAEVEVLAADVTTPDSIATVAEQVKARFGQCDVLLHGAGREESKMIVDKSEESFDGTFAPKSRALLLLHSALEPTRTVSMGSIAGRFGNAGQTDYAQANELLAAFSRSIGNAVCLDWTAWGDVGMATKEGVKKVLESLGVEFLPADLGAQIGADLLASDIRGDVVVAGSLGEIEAGELGNVAQCPRLFDRVERQEGQVTYVRSLDPSRDIGLDHHRLQGVALLPGVLGIEMIAQAAAHASGKSVVALEDVSFASPLKLHRDAAMEVQIRVADSGDSEKTVHLVTVFEGPGGKARERVHFTAKVLFGAPLGLVAPASRSMHLPRSPGINREAIYQRYFHGPVFQVLEAPTTLGEDGIVGDTVGSWPEWVEGCDHDTFATSPFIREAGFQAAGLWEMVELGRMALPAGVERIELSTNSARAQAVRVEARRTGSGADGSTFDVWSVDVEGRIVDVMRGYRTVVLRHLGDDERFEPAKAVSPAPDWLWVELSEIEAKLDKDKRGTLEKYLSPTERGRFDALKTRKRQLEWLAGRIAAKRLIREVHFSGEGAVVSYAAITVQTNSLGAPEITIVGEKGEEPRVSISHSAGVAAALVAREPGLAPGIDVEAIESRSDAFVRDYFTEFERGQIEREPARRDARVTAIWAVKEAIMKSLGIGARVDFRQIEVTLVDEGSTLSATVEYRGKALERARELGAGAAQTVIETQGSRVIARVMLPVKQLSDPEHIRP